MKLRNLFFASLAMVTFAACSNDNDPLPDPEAQVVDAGDVNINIVTKSSSTTKAEGDTQKGESVESTVNSLKIYVFENEKYFTEEAVTSAGTENNGYKDEKLYSNIKISGLKTNTKYDFVAVANFNETGQTLTGKTLEQLQKMVLTYAPINPFVMSGSYSTSTLNTGANTFTINISRRLAAVQLEGVKLQLPEDAPENFKAAKAYLTEIYLVNAKATAQLGTDYATGATDIEIAKAAYLHGSNNNIHKDPQNKTEGFWGSKNDALLKHPAIPNNKLQLITNVNATTGLGDNVRLYAFPTTSENIAEASHPIMLKLRVEFDAAENAEPITDNVRYYTIYLKPDGGDQTTIPTTYGVKNNALYKVTATIKGLGSKRDDVVEETAGEVIASIQVMPWTVVKQNEGNLTD